MLVYTTLILSASHLSISLAIYQWRSTDILFYYDLPYTVLQYVYALLYTNSINFVEPRTTSLIINCYMSLGDHTCMVILVYVEACMAISSLSSSDILSVV